MSKYFFESKLGKSRFKLADGSLLCKDVPIARTGTMDYSSLDFKDDPNFDSYPQRIIQVTRGETALFDEATLASFEAMAFTDDHPDEFITPDNWSKYAKGHIQNVRRGDGENSDTVIADIVVKDADTITKIEQGKVELSCGYDAAYEFTSKDTGEQTAITGNHLALVDSARGGSRLKINTGDSHMSKKSLLKRLFKDKEDIEKEIKDALLDEDKENETTDSDDLKERVERLEAQVKKLISEQKETSDSDDDDKPAKDKETKDKKSKDSDGDKEDEKSKTEDSGILTTDEAYKASLIVPHMTFTQGGIKGKRKVLDAAMQTNGRAELVRGIVGNKCIDSLSDVEVNIAFNAIAEASKSLNRPSINMRDGAPIQAQSIADVNENFWRPKQ